MIARRHTVCRRQRARRIIGAPGVDGGDGFGGTVNVFTSGGSSLNVAGAADLRADGRAGATIECFSVRRGRRDRRRRHGQRRRRSTPAPATFWISAANLSMQANGQGGQGVTGAGGTGSGGNGNFSAARRQHRDGRGRCIDLRLMALAAMRMARPETAAMALAASAMPATSLVLRRRRIAATQRQFHHCRRWLWRTIGVGDRRTRHRRARPIVRGRRRRRDGRGLCLDHRLRQWRRWLDGRCRDGRSRLFQQQPTTEIFRSHGFAELWGQGNGGHGFDGDGGVGNGGHAEAYANNAVLTFGNDLHLEANGRGGGTSLVGATSGDGFGGDIYLQAVAGGP